MELPAELRMMVYTSILQHDRRLHQVTRYNEHTSKPISSLGTLLTLDRQVHEEALDVVYHCNAITLNPHWFSGGTYGIALPTPPPDEGRLRHAHIDGDGRSMDDCENAHHMLEDLGDLPHLRSVTVVFKDAYLFLLPMNGLKKYLAKDAGAQELHLQSTKVGIVEVTGYRMHVEIHLESLAKSWHLAAQLEAQYFPKLEAPDKRKVLERTDMTKLPAQCDDHYLLASFFWHCRSFYGPRGHLAPALRPFFRLKS